MSQSLPRTVAQLLTGAGAAGSAALLWLSVRRRPVPVERRIPEPPPNLPPGTVVHVPGYGEFFVRDTGAPADRPDAPPIVLLHGWMFSADVTWFTCYEELARYGRVIAADHRGHGRGPRPIEPFRLADVADDVAALLRHLGVDSAVVVGYSMGGTIAQLFWHRHPELVRGLILAATSASFSVDARDRWAWRMMGALQLILRVFPRDMWERAAHAQAKSKSNIRLSRLISPATPAEVIELLPWITGELSRDSAEDVAEAGREMGRFDARGWLGTVDVPTAVLITGDDGLVAPANQRDLAARVPDCYVEELAIDHDGVVSRPDVFVPALVKAVQQVLNA
ncbi:MAG TPA: alpha/beta fold hydrolase [Egibacteraceae bacterium]|nr:alpha/beta fold hydrolase [Egibacteraceae bacterium]